MEKYNHTKFESELKRAFVVSIFLVVVAFSLSVLIKNSMTHDPREDQQVTSKP